MTSPLPQHLQDEQRALEAEIREAFKGVTREGGVSWHQTPVIDVGGTEQEMAAAAALDTEPDWQALVDDEGWFEENHRWGFLDAIGCRYYFAPAMIRCVRRGKGWAFAYGLAYAPCAQDAVALMNSRQKSALKRFIGFMIGADADTKEWRAAAKAHGGLA